MSLYDTDNTWLASYLCLFAEPVKYEMVKNHVHIFFNMEDIGDKLVEWIERKAIVNLRDFQEKYNKLIEIILEVKEKEKISRGGDNDGMC